MATTTSEIDPAGTALVVMDCQPGILSRVSDADVYVQRVRGAVQLMREAGATIAWVRVGFSDDDIARMPDTASMLRAVRRDGDAVHADAPQTQYDARLAPAEGDIAVRKSRVGALSSTDLDIQLRGRGIDTLALAGIATSGAVLSTVRDAADRDYRQFVIRDACTDPDPDTHDFLCARIFPRQASVVTVEELAPKLSS